MTALAVFLGVIGIVFHAHRVADRRDRSPLLWSALTLAAAVGATWGSWRWLAGSIDSNGNMLLAAFAMILGPLAAPALVVLGLRRMAPGRPSIAGAVAVRQLGAGGQSLQLELDDGGARLLSADGTERRIADVDLDRIQPDGECLRLRLRATGEELRLQITEFDDRERRLRTCDALAAALGRRVADARVVTR
jgi:hypothetical protein